ncbi:MAG: ABC transporter ATP-binding protein [Verrucomicrobiales bacterium]|nr:ABC transporter ATP-binding protein [Verrucomicrobiales bacterium]
MPAFLHNTSDLIRKVYILARPYGRKKLLVVTALSFAQGLFQVIGVTSIFPFLALAADPARLRNSEIGHRILDFLPPLDDHRLLTLAGVFALLMLFLANGINLFAEFIRTRYSHGFGHWLRTGLLRRIATRPYTDFLHENSAILVKKIVGDVMNFTTGILLPLLDSFARIATIILLIGTLFLVHPGIAASASIGLGLFYVIIFRAFSTWRSRTSAGLHEANSGIYTEAQQMLGGIKPVKVHRCEEAFIERFSSFSRKQAKFMGWVGIVSNGPRYLVEPLAFGGVVIAVLFYASRGQDLSIILPNLGVMALAGYRLLPAIQLLYGQTQTLAIMRHSLDEVFDEFLAAEKAVDKEAESIDGFLTRPPALHWTQSIQMQNLSFSYPGSEKRVIDNLSVTIPKNSSLGIVGTTGCGKSTLVDLLLGLHTPSAGQILIDGVPLDSGNRRAWRGGVGYVPQEIFLIDDSIAANIAFGIPEEEIDTTALERACTAAQIFDFINSELPEKFKTKVGERGIRLSGGQRQRIGLARALYSSPEVLILDEATSSLDLSTEAEIMKSINSLKGDVTTIIIAHRLSTIQECDQRLSLSSTN